MGGSCSILSAAESSTQRFKSLRVTSALLVVTGATLVVTKGIATSNKKLLGTGALLVVTKKLLGALRLKDSSLFDRFIHLQPSRDLLSF